MKRQSLHKSQAPSLDVSAEEFLSRRRKKIFSTYSFVFLVLSAALLWWLISQLNYKDFFVSLQSVSSVWIIAALAFYLLANQLKAFRYYLLLYKTNLSFSVIAAITSYQNFFNQIMPARTGELTLMYYLKKMGNVSGSVGLHALILTRIYDLIIVALGFALGLIFHFNGKIPFGLLVIAVFFLILASSLLLLSRIFLTWMIKISDKLTQAIGIKENKVISFMQEKLKNLEITFRQSEKEKRIPAMIGSSLLVWLALYLFAYSTIKAFKVEISFWLSIVGSTGQILANVLPINSFGSFGTLEAGWTGGYMLAGMSKQDAITTGIGYHLLNFAGSAVIAFFFFLFLKTKKLFLLKTRSSKKCMPNNTNTKSINHINKN